MKSIISIFILLTLPWVVAAQSSIEEQTKSIYENALNSESSYQNLNELCSKAPGRLMGSKQAEIARNLLINQLKKYHPDTIYLQEYNHKSWCCKSPAKASIKMDGEKINLHVVNLGLSGSAAAQGITANIVEVHSLAELDSLAYQVKGKIVFFNRAMKNSSISTFDAYSGAIDQRSMGALKSSVYGAVGAIVRSLNPDNDDYPHTGVSRIEEGRSPIPNLAISTNDADLLHRAIKMNHSLQIYILSQTEVIPSVKVANIVAEIKGTTHPERIILLGAHYDSWFNTPGAHDDGAGCMQVLDILRIFRELNIQTENTIRFVLYMDEEMYQSGAKEYLKNVEKEGRTHLACIETDAGGLLPIGFEVNATDQLIQRFSLLAAPLKKYGIYSIEKGYGGVDIAPLKQKGYPLIGLQTNSQRYFEYHHSGKDNVEQVSRREMQLGTAALAAITLIIDRNGL